MFEVKRGVVWIKINSFKIKLKGKKDYRLFQERNEGEEEII